MGKVIQYNNLIQNVFDFCIKTGVKFLLISGIGGSGKSTLAKEIKKCFEKNNFTANIVRYNGHYHLNHEDFKKFFFGWTQCVRKIGLIRSKICVDQSTPTDIANITK